MENLIPILLGLVFLGIKYYNKTQKEKAKKGFQQIPTQEKKEEFNPSLNDFLNQFYPEEKKPFSEPAIVNSTPENVSIKSWKEQMHEQEPESIEFNDEHARNKKRNSQFETIQNKPSQTTETLDFDLRKAIAYDAIMNPPYL